MDNNLETRRPCRVCEERTRRRHARNRRQRKETTYGNVHLHERLPNSGYETIGLPKLPMACNSPSVVCA
jgi:hypothetical protein